MTEKEFKNIIKPLGLLTKDHKEFLESAMLGNFRRWKAMQELTTPENKDENV